MTTIEVGRGRLFVQSRTDPDQWVELGAREPTPARSTFTHRTSVITGIGEALVNRHARRRELAIAKATRRVTTTTTRGIPTPEGTGS